MVTENGRLAEVTKAAEPMGHPASLSGKAKGKTFTTESTESHRGTTKRLTVQCLVCGFPPVKLRALCGKSVAFVLIQLLRHQFIDQLRIRLAL
jgi:hypothetical protein